MMWSGGNSIFSLDPQVTWPLHCEFQVRYLFLVGKPSMCSVNTVYPAVPKAKETGTLCINFEDLGEVLYLYF